MLVFRPLIATPARARRRGRDHRARLRADAAAARAARDRGRRCSAGTAGARALGKARSLTLAPARRCAAGRAAASFDLALAHGSHELTMTARRLGIPSATTFDYEFAWLQHQLGCRAATRVVVPEAIPPERLARYGARPPKLRPVPGPEGGVLPRRLRARPRACSSSSSVDPARTLVVVRTPPDVSLYHRRSNPLFPQVLDHLGRDEDVHAVVLPRTDEQREYVRGLGLPSVQRARARRRRAEPDRVRRPRRLGRRDDEPRGGRARRAGLHDLRRPARRRRRGADPRGAADSARRPARPRPAQARAASASASGATRR